jgi:YqjK-like protein
MSTKRKALAARRTLLTQRAAAEREAFARAIGRLDRPLRWVGRGYGVLRYLRSHPIIPIGAALLFTLRRRRSVFRLLRNVVLVRGMLRASR